jgi:lysozyme family protein
MDGSAGATEVRIDGQRPFADAVRWVIKAEGGSKLVEDTGGLTKWGISSKAHPGVNIRDLTERQAIDLYFEKYWEPIKGNALPEALAFVVFDAAVNMGVPASVKMLQTALRIEADGVVGPQTISAARLFLPRSELIAQVLNLRLSQYAELGKKETYARYLYGWRMRTLRLAIEVGKWRGL